MRAITSINENTTFADILGMRADVGGGGAAVGSESGILLFIGDQVVQYPVPSDHSEAFFASLMRHKVYGFASGFQVVDTVARLYENAMRWDAFTASKPKPYLIHSHPAPMLHRDKRAGRFNVEGEALVFAYSSGTTRDVILQNHKADPRPDNKRFFLHGRLALGDEAQQGEFSCSGNVYPLIGRSLSCLSKSWLKDHKNIHVIKDYDGVVHIKDVRRIKPSLFSRHIRRSNETASEFRARLVGQNIEVNVLKGAVEYDKYQTAFKAYFQRGQAFGPANLKAAEYGAYRSDEQKIGRLINAIMNEDHPDRVHILVDDKEDILTAVYNFFRRYPHLMQGKLVLYKSCAVDKKDDNGNITMPAGRISLCQWVRSVNLSQPGQDFFTLKPEAGSPAIIHSVAEFTAQIAISAEDKSDFALNDKLHAKWGAYIAEKVAEDAHVRFDMPQAVIADTDAFIQGTATELLSFKQQHRLVSMVNGMYLAVEQATGTKTIETDGVQRRLSEAEKAAHRLNRFDQEIQAAHFVLRKQAVAQLLLPEKLGHIAVMAAMSTRQISKIVFPDDADLSEAAILRELLQRFPCGELSPSFIALLQSEEAEPDVRASPRSRTRSIRSRSMHSVAPAVEIKDIEMHNAADAPGPKRVVLLKDMSEIEVQGEIASWSELIGWLRSLSMRPQDFQRYLVANATLGIKTVSLTLIAQRILQQYYIQADCSERLKFVPFDLDPDGVYHAMLASPTRVGGRYTMAWPVPQRSEDGNVPVLYRVKEDGEQGVVCDIKEFPIDASAESTRHWRGLGPNVKSELAKSRAAQAGEYVDARPYLGREKFGNRLSLADDDWMVSVARALLPGFIDFKESGQGVDFFTDLALLLNLPQGERRLETAQNVWQTLLQALETGWPQQYVTIPSGHQVIWYEKLFALCKYFIFIKPKHRFLERAYDSLDMEVVMVRMHAECVLRARTDLGILDAFNAMFAQPAEATDIEHGADTEATFSSPLIDILIAPFVETNQTMHSSSRLVTTPEKLESFLLQMVEEVQDVGNRASRMKAKQYGLALEQLCALPFANESMRDTSTIEMAAQHLKMAMLGLDFRMMSHYELTFTPKRYDACMGCVTQVFEGMPAAIKTITRVGVFKGILDLDADQPGIDFFQRFILENTRLFQLFRQFTQPTTMPVVYREDGKTKAKLFSANPYAFESTAESFARLVRQLIRADEDSEFSQQAMYVLFNAVLIFPFNLANNALMRVPISVADSVDADNRMPDLQGRIESLLVMSSLSVEEIFGLYQVVEGYRSVLDNDSDLYGKIIYYKTGDIFSLFDAEVYACLDKKAEAEKRSILCEAIASFIGTEEKQADLDVIVGGGGGGAAADSAVQVAQYRRRLHSMRPSVEYIICSSKNWREFFERVALRYWDTRIPESRWHKVHKWWVLTLTSLPPISAGLALQVLQEMEAALSNTTAINGTTAQPDAGIGKYNQPITIAWLALGTIVFGARTAAATGFFPKKGADIALWRYSTMALELVLATGAIGATTVLTLLGVDNPDAFFLGNLTRSMGKAHAGAMMLGHASGYSEMIAPLLIIIGCTPTLKRILGKSSRVLILAAAVSGGCMLSINPIASALFDIGGYAQPFNFILEAVGNILESVISTSLGAFFALGIGTAFILGSYRIPPAYKALGSLLYAMGLMLTGVSVANIAVLMSNYLSGSTATIPDWVAFIVAHSSVFVGGTLAGAAVLIVAIIAGVECRRDEIAPSLFQREIKCYKSKGNDEQADGEDQSQDRMLRRASLSGSGAALLAASQPLRGMQRVAEVDGDSEVASMVATSYGYGTGGGGGSKE